jgi:hypothetical protein
METRHYGSLVDDKWEYILISPQYTLHSQVKVPMGSLLLLMFEATAAVVVVVVVVVVMKGFYN